MDRNAQLDGPALFRALGDEIRWRLVRELRWSDRSVAELVRQVGAPQNLVSYHLQTLREAGLVRSRKSESDGRTVYYGLDLPRLAAAYGRLDETLHLTDPSAAPSALTVAFLCTNNSARSQMAEGWLRALVPEGLRVRSAGTKPSSLHPLAVEVMAERDIDIGHQRAKGSDELNFSAVDVAVTVCDLAREACLPDLAGVRHLHWSIADPARGPGGVDDQRGAFRAARDDIEGRVRGLVRLLGDRR